LSYLQEIAKKTASVKKERKGAFKGIAGRVCPKSSVIITCFLASSLAACLPGALKNGPVK